MSFGVARGIEKVNRIMMPAFFVLFFFLAVRVAFLDGSAPGYSYLFKPDWSEMANPHLLLNLSSVVICFDFIVLNSLSFSSSVQMCFYIRKIQQNKWGFVISCIGSSVGMANIWLFPYRAGEFGGAAFLIPYIIFVVLIGFTGVIGEMAFGRAMQSGPLGAFKKAYEMKGSKLGTFIGLIPVIGSLGIAIGYSVIIGWILKFFADSITGKIISEEDNCKNSS